MRARFRRRRITIPALALAACTPVAIAPKPVPPSDPPRAARIEVDVERIVNVARAIVAGGPREATSDAYDAAAHVVERAFSGFGYSVGVHRFRVPDGVSWGIEVPAGMSSNLFADPPGFDATKRHLIVGAHLDTVPQAPGANDNASGVSVMVELARLASLDPPRIPIRFIAFGAEEPRRSGDDGHHYGSRAYVDLMRAKERRSLVGMISLDRVGIGRRVRVCTGSGFGAALANEVLESARALDIRATRCFNRTSDHWSFERNRLPGVRLLGAEHITYHTPLDRMNVLERAQLVRIARLTWETLKRLG